MSRTPLFLLVLALPGIASAAAGGPDANGYSWLDSDEVGGPAFAFEDISGTGTATFLTDDSQISVNLGFTFPWSGSNYTSVNVTSNGMVGLNGGTTSYGNACPMPTTGIPSHSLQVLWDDLNPASAGEVYYRSFPTAQPPYFIAQWHQVPQYGQTNSHTFQVKMFANGTVEYHYQRTDSGGSGATISVQTGTGVALQYSCNQPSIRAGLAIRFSRCDDTIDLDNDGYSECFDCDDFKPYVRPGAPDTCDGIDNDCNGLDGPDADRDGWSTCDRDCDDGNAQIYPTQTEIPCDGIDQDCDIWTLDNPDFDRDGFNQCTSDCDDRNAAVSPNGVEVLCNGLDDDCNPATPDNVDGDDDGYLLCTEDCDDTNPLISPIAVEIVCNGIDEDCDFFNTPDGPDNDGDANSTCDGDCDDNNAAINTLRAERPCNNVDDDCNPATPDLADLDGDGASVCDDDCDDGDPAVGPGVEEVFCNYIDDDCRDRTDDDADEDRDGVSVCAGDCDDTQPTVSPRQSERCGDGLDNNCNGTVDERCEVEDTDTTTEPEVGCAGCAQGSPSGAFGGLSLALLALVRRRRAATEGGTAAQR